MKFRKEKIYCGDRAYESEIARVKNLGNVRIFFNEESNSWSVDIYRRRNALLESEVKFLENYAKNSEEWNENARPAWFVRVVMATEYGVNVCRAAVLLKTDENHISKRYPLDAPRFLDGCLDSFDGVDCYDKALEIAEHAFDNLHIVA